MQRTTSPPPLPRNAWRCYNTCGRPREYWRVVEDDAGGVFIGLLHMRTQPQPRTDDGCARDERRAL